MDIIKRITNFLFELNETKRTPRNGWHRAGVKYPESVAEHTAVCSQIAYLLAIMEGVNAEHAAALALFHDTAEVREGDNDWVTRIYCVSKDKDSAALSQFEGLPISGNMASAIKELRELQTNEAVIVKDADMLEMALQARVYEQSGYQSAGLYLKSMRDGLKTDSAKKILAAIEQSNIQDWWLAIPEIAAIASKLLRK